MLYSLGTHLHHPTDTTRRTGGPHDRKRPPCRHRWIFAPCSPLRLRGYYLLLQLIHTTPGSGRGSPGANQDGKDDFVPTQPRHRFIFVFRCDSSSFSAPFRLEIHVLLPILRVSSSALRGRGLPSFEYGSIDSLHSRASDTELILSMRPVILGG